MTAPSILRRRDGGRIRPLLRQGQSPRRHPLSKKMRRALGTAGQGPEAPAPRACSPCRGAERGGAGGAAAGAPGLCHQPCSSRSPCCSAPSARRAAGLGSADHCPLSKTNGKKSGKLQIDLCLTHTATLLPIFLSLYANTSQTNSKACQSKLHLVCLK